jgi:hypothetical protein
MAHYRNSVIVLVPRSYFLDASGPRKNMTDCSIRSSSICLTSDYYLLCGSNRVGADVLVTPKAGVGEIGVRNNGVLFG